MERPRVRTAGMPGRGKHLISGLKFVCAKLDVTHADERNDIVGVAGKSGGKLPLGGIVLTVFQMDLSESGASITLFRINRHGTFQEVPFRVGVARAPGDKRGSK